MLLFILLLAIVDALLGVIVFSFNDNDKVCFDHSKDRVARGFTGFNGIQIQYSAVMNMFCVV